MSNLESIIKYDMGATTSVAGEQPYKSKTSIGPIIDWSMKDKLNGLREYTIKVPNDEFHRANVLVERDVSIPFVGTPINGIIVEKQLSDSFIQIKVIEDGFHLTRRIWRQGTVKDETTNNNHGTVTGTTTFVNGKHASAFSFNDTTYITLANETNFDFERTNTFSMGGWIKVDSADVGQWPEKTLYDKINGSVGIRVYFGSDNLLYISLSSSGSNLVKVHYATSIMTQAWIHMFVTYAGNSQASGVKLYINGSEVALVTDNDNLSATILHNTAPRLGFYYKGLMDEWRVYNVTLAAARVAEVYTNMESLTGLVARYQFNTARHEYTNTGVNAIAQAILDHANEDQPAGVTWTLETGTPTTEVSMKFNWRTHWQALQDLADTGGYDLWTETESHKINLAPFRSKGKTINQKLDVVVQTVPKTSLMHFANQVNVLGKNLGNDKQIESLVETDTDLKYKYEKVLTNGQLNTQSKATGVADKLLQEYKILTPTIKAKMPYDQFVRYVLETGDVIRVAESQKEITDQFRIMEMQISPKEARLSMESTATAVSPTKSRSLTEIIGIMLERIKTNEIVG